MSANQTIPLRTEGEALLQRLCEIGMKRLRDHGIEMKYTPAVLEWLLDQPDWQSSLNPLRTLNGDWHQQVATHIEGLLLDGSLRAGVSLSVIMGETPTGPQIQFHLVPGIQDRVGREAE